MKNDGIRLGDTVYFKNIPFQVTEVNIAHLTVVGKIKGVEQSMTLNKENFTLKPK